MCRINFDKPPLGLMPRKLYEQQQAAERVQALKQAISGYVEAGQLLPAEWIEEYNELLKSAAFMGAALCRADLAAASVT